MLRTCFSIALGLASVLAVGTHSTAQATGLSNFVRGSVVEYGYGPGTSSNRPRVEIRVALCASGTYRTQGRSCRPNLIAKGYQCSNFTDSGNWRVSGNSLQWMSYNGTPGSLNLFRRGGRYVDSAGNPMVRVGSAGC